MNCRTYVLSFDVADDRRRAKLSKYLASKGQRVQWSVFEVIATGEQMADILRGATVERRFDPSVDSLRCYALCAGCQAVVEVHGRGLAPNVPGRPIVV